MNDFLRFSGGFCAHSAMVYLTTFKQMVFPSRSPLVRVKRAARRVWLNAVSILAAPWPPAFLRCLYCHYVFEDQTAALGDLLAALAAVGRFVDTPTCVDMLEGRRPIDGRYFHLSFDDGFRNVFTQAVPILKQHRIPAIVFVSSELVDADWSRAYAFGQSCIPPLAGAVEMIRWDDLRQMSDDGFEIGSHTRTHRRLSEISGHPSLLRDEIEGSAKQIEDRLGVRCDYISWPYGRPRDADAASISMMKESGYRACFGAYRGSVIPAATSRYAIPRHHFELQWPLSHILYFAKGHWERPACGL